jgi:hypothetical protein
MPEVMESTFTTGGASLFAPAVVLGVLGALVIVLGGMMSLFSLSVLSVALSSLSVSLSSLLLSSLLLSLSSLAAASSSLWLEVVATASAAVSRKCEDKA